jgi:hypothetical protein
MGMEHIPDGATFVTTRAIEVEVSPGVPRVHLESSMRLRHLRSHDWWSGNIEYAEYFFEVEDGRLAGTEVCIVSAQVNAPAEDLTELTAARGLVLVSEPNAAAGSRHNRQVPNE